MSGTPPDGPSSGIEPDRHQESFGQIFDLYSLAVEMADRVSARRSGANTFFLTVQTALTAVVGFVVSVDGASEWVIGLVSAAGIITCLAWWALLRSYRDLASAKWEVITAIEKEHFTVRPFADEWDYLKKDDIKSWRERYAEQGTVERFVPWVFVGVYALLAAGALC